MLGQLGNLWANSGLRVPTPGSVYYLCVAGEGLVSFPAMAYGR